MNNMRNESARPGKRPLRAMTTPEKLQAIKRVNDGESKASVARDIGVPESTLRGWCKTEGKIRNSLNATSTRNSKSPESLSSTSSGTNNHNVEDEPPLPKKTKFDHQPNAQVGIPTPYNENGDVKINYFANTMPNGYSVQPELLNDIYRGNNVPTNNGFNALRTSHTNVVGLVENGLQYTRSNNNPLMVNNSTIRQDNGRQTSLPSNWQRINGMVPMERSMETPSTSQSVSPTNSSAFSENYQRMNRQNNNNNNVTTPNGGLVTNITSEQLYAWLCRQQELELGNPRNRLALFWLWYSREFQAMWLRNLQSIDENLAREVQKKDATVASRCQTLDHAVHTNGCVLPTTTVCLDSGSDVPSSIDEALEHAEKFYKWLNKCSEPVVTQSKIMQLRLLMDSLKASNNVLHSQASTEKTRKRKSETITRMMYRKNCDSSKVPVDRL